MDISISLNLYGYLFISMDIALSLWKSFYLYGYLFISMDIFLSLWISLYLYGFGTNSSGRTLLRLSENFFQKKKKKTFSDNF
jgi:hypothetical protein